MSENYQTIWNQYWNVLLTEKEGAFWDKNINLENKEFLDLKSEYVSSLPLVDLGCGTGHRTRLLSSFHPNVIGMDISESVIAHAKTTYPALRFQQVDVLDDNERDELLQDLGNVNIYCRGVLHQLALADRPKFISAIARLAGGKGIIYLQEMAVDFKEFVTEKYSTFSNAPMSIKKVLFSKFSPQPLDVEQTSQSFEQDGYQLVKKVDSSLNITLPGSEKSQLEVPAVHLLYAPGTYVENK